MLNSEILQTKIRLDYLDGMRGISALYVVVFHVYFDVAQQLKTAEISRFAKGLIDLVFSQGRGSVEIFIILSGYCLMIPVARSIDGKLKGGLRQYIQRRSRRILPPYYIVLLLSLLLSSLVPAELLPAMGAQWNLGQPAWTPGAILSHLLLVHNLTEWSIKINPPMWSVALEWQIYFLFPLVLLPIWRQFGCLAVLGAACVISLCWSTPYSWFVVLFTLGMITADLTHSQKAFLKDVKQKFPWSRIALGLMPIWIIAVRYKMNEAFCAVWLALAVSCLLISCTQAVMDGKHTAALSFFQAPLAIAVGAFSYSLYLTHALVLGIVELAISGLHLSPLVKFIVLLVLTLPPSLFFAYFFHLLFEKRFLSSSK